MSRKLEVGIVNTVCNNATNTAPQVVLIRIRGQQNAKTIKVPPSLSKEGIPLAGEAVYLDFDEKDLKDAGPNYRILRNAKISFNAPMQPSGPNQADNLTDEQIDEIAGNATTEEAPLEAATEPHDTTAATEVNPEADPF